MDSIATGVVLIGRNEGPRLVAALESVNPKLYSVVYVDSGSTDGSREAALGTGATVVSLHLGSPFTAARARNAGYEALRRDRPDIGYIQFVDGDCTLDPGWMDMATTFMDSHPDVAVVAGRRREKFPSASLYNLLCDREWNTPVGEATACGGDALFRVAAFEAVGGYRAQLIAGEEPELCLRLRELGWKIWRLDAEMTRHDANIMRFSQFWARAVRAGHAYAEVAWLHRSSAFSIWKANVVRAVLWGAVLPLFLLAGALANRVVLLGALVYPLQITRLALKQRDPPRVAWASAALTVVGKFAECVGIVKYAWRRMRGGSALLIEYK